MDTENRSARDHMPEADGETDERPHGSRPSLDPELRAKRLTAALTVCTAVLTLLTALLGFLSVRFNNQRDEAKDEAAAFSSQLDVQAEQIGSLEAERSSLATDVDELRRERDALQQQLDEATADDGSPPDSDPLPPNRVYLSDEQSLNRLRFDSGTAQVSGETYVHSLLGTQGWMSSSTDATESYAEYDLGRAYETFTATIGLSDRNRNANRTVKFEVILDNEQIYEAELAAGEAEEITVSVTDGLRLRLVLTFFQPQDLSSSDQFDKAVFGDAVLDRSTS